jgi:hypothetical protein
MPRYACLLIACCAFVATSVLADDPKAKAPDDPIKARLTVAKDKYRAAAEKAGKELMADFDEYEKLLRENKLPKKLSATDQLKAIDQLEEERKAFAASPTDLPKAEGMKKAKADYEASLKKSRDLCDKAFAEAETSYQAQPDPTSGKKPNRTAILALAVEKEEFYKGGGGAVVGGGGGGDGGATREDLRKVWKPAKNGSTFEWIREGEWKEVYADRSGAKFFKEVSRTDKQIELYAKTYSLHYRIEADKVWVRMDPEPKWRVYSEGGWSNDVPEASAEKPVKIDWAAVKKAAAKMTVAQLRDDRAGEPEVGTQALSPAELESLVNTTYTSKQSGSAYTVSGVEALKATNAAIAVWKSLAAMATDPNVPEKSRLQVLDVTIAKATAAEEAVSNPVVKRAFGDWAKLLAGFKKGDAKSVDAVTKALVGTWQVTQGSYTATYEFKADGTVVQQESKVRGKPYPDATGKWTLEPEKNRVYIRWNNNTDNALELPIDPKGTGGQILPRERMEAVKKADKADPGTADDIQKIIVGTWQMTIGGYRGTWEFKKDGTVSQEGSAWNGRPIADNSGKWIVEAEKKRVLLKWDNGAMDQMDLPLDPKGTTGSMIGRNEAKLLGIKK